MPEDGSRYGARRAAHVVLIPFEDRGHITPLMVLAKKLAILGLSVTIIFPNKQSHLLITGQGKDASEGLDIKFEVLEDTSGTGTGDNQVNGGMPWIPQQQRDLEQMLQLMIASPSPPVGVLVDIMVQWTRPVLKKLQLPRYVFYSSAGVNLAGTCRSRGGPPEGRPDRPEWRHFAMPEGARPDHGPGHPAMRPDHGPGHLPMPEGAGVDHRPGHPPMRPDHGPGHLPTPEGAGVDHRPGPPGHHHRPHHHARYDWREDLLEAEGILVNTSAGLEGRAIGTIRADFKEYVLPVGPLLPSSYFDEDSDIMGAIKASTILHSSEETRCKEWMDGQKPSSVLFVSFGSRTYLPDNQVQEVALGLEASNQPFLWVLPTPPKAASSAEYLHNVLPEGFEERMKKQGLIIPGWAPQHLILTHPSLGGFMTHCGWNSVLECICLSGVPMLCWPFDADQPVICRFLVNDVKVGLQVFKGENGMVGRDEVAKQVKLIFSGAEAEAMRSRLVELKSATRMSVAEGGSSVKNLERFVGDMQQRREALSLNNK